MSILDVKSVKEVKPGKSVKTHSVVLHSENLHTWKAGQPFTMESQNGKHEWDIKQLNKNMKYKTLCPCPGYTQGNITSTFSPCV